MREIWVWSLGREDPLEKRRATHSSILAWRIPRTEVKWNLCAASYIPQEPIFQLWSMCLAQHFLEELFLRRYTQLVRQLIVLCRWKPEKHSVKQSRAAAAAAGLLRGFNRRMSSGEMTEQVLFPETTWGQSCISRLISLNWWVYRISVWEILASGI